VAVGDELSRSGEIPKATVKEDNGRALIDFVVVVCREEKVSHQVTLRSLLVDIGCRGRKEFLVPDFTNHG